MVNVEIAMPFVILPALLFGLVGGAYAGSREIARLTGVLCTYGVFVLVLSVVPFIPVIADGSLEEVLGVLNATAGALFLGILVGAMPLVIGYLLGDYVNRRIHNDHAASSDGA